MSRVASLTWVLALWVCGPLSAQQSCKPVLVNSRSVHTCVAGIGATTIVLAAGAGQTSQTWNDLALELSAIARIVTFDRPGLGRSEPGVAPRTPTQIARELRIVLEALAVEGPIVLIGHSMGGLHVLRYGSLFPDRVVAVFILDAPPPGFEDDRLELLTPVEREERRRILAQGIGNAPATVRLEREGAADDKEWDFSGFPRAIPLIVVAADSQEFGDLGNPGEHRRLWVAKSRQWLDLSDRAEFVVAEGSGHMIHQDHRVLVTELVERLLDRRNGSDLHEPQPTDGLHLTAPRSRGRR